MGWSLPMRGSRSALMIVRSSEMSTRLKLRNINRSFGQHGPDHGGLLQQAPYPPIIGPHRTSLSLIGRGARLWLGATNTSVSGLIEQNSRDSTPSARSKSLVDMSRPTLLRFQLWSLRYSSCWSYIVDTSFVFIPERNVRQGNPRQNTENTTRRQYLPWEEE